MAELLRDPALRSFAAKQSLFDARAQSLCTQDASAVTDIAHLEHTRSSLEKAIEGQMRACLPSREGGDLVPDERGGDDLVANPDVLHDEQVRPEPGARVGGPS